MEKKKNLNEKDVTNLYVNSKKTICEISEKFNCSPQWIYYILKHKGINTSRKGKKLSDVHKKNLSKSWRYDKHFNESIRENISKAVSKNLPSTSFKKGFTPWNKGLTKKTDARVKDISEKNLGREKSSISILKQSETRKRLFKEGKLIHPMLGKHQTKEAKSKMKNEIFKRGNNKKSSERMRLNNPMKKFETKEKMRYSIHKLMIEGKRIFPIKDTKIEIKIQNFLKELKIEFFTHQYIHIEHGYQCDIFIPSKNLVIECDGNYWHSYPTGREIDHIRTKELIDKGFKVLRLWEFEIKEMTIKDFEEKLVWR